MIERCLHRVFEGDRQEATQYGFENVQVQYYAVETVQSWEGKVGQRGGILDTETEEESLLIMDDTWLKLAQVMWTRDRKSSRTRRQSEFQNRQGPEWSVKAIQNVRKRK